MMRSDDRRRFWKVLTIDRLNPLKLTMYDHSITYSSSQRIVLLDKINLRNASSGGLKFITLCHGIVGMETLVFLNSDDHICLFFIWVYYKNHKTFLYT